MQVTATEAKNRFGALCAQAKKAPVFVEKSGRIDSVIVSFDDYQRMFPGQTETPQALSDGARRFYEENKEWMDRVNRRVASHGVWCEGALDEVDAQNVASANSRPHGEATRKSKASFDATV
jgi:PHD/YefM family antitoxin component YafN of YafNO toxin-antitoxin module